MDHPFRDASESAEAERRIEREVQQAMMRLRSRQNLPAAITAGVAASLVGAALWTLASVSTGSGLGFLAIGIAFFISFAVRQTGNGIDRIFGYTSAACLLVSLVTSNSVSILLLISQQHGLSLEEVLSKLSFGRALTLLATGISPFAVLFYLIALGIAYKQAFRRVTAAELEE